MHPPDSYTLVTIHSCGRRDKTNVLVSNYTKSVWFVNGESFQKWAQVGKEFVNPPTFSKERYVPLSREHSNYVERESFGITVIRKRKLTKGLPNEV